ncbi:MAG: GGDEF domain-containing protein [Gammaproteobacteria bacterium]|nr:GGDEF domain-containing protein [Gammaproteobacteria bacterium]
MEHKTLSMVADITQQNDVDSLNQSFLIAIAELTPCHSISLYQAFKEDLNNGIEELLRLDNLKKNDAFFCHQWNTKSTRITSDPQLKCSFQKSDIAFYTEDQRAVALFPIVLDNKITSVIKISSTNPLTTQLTLIKNLLKIYQNYLFILNESERDKLTGIFNRRTFDKKLLLLLNRQRTQQYEYKSDHQPRKTEQDSTAWLAILDIDFFKRVNDDYGHLYGDEVLLLLSQQMKAFFRSSDLLFRFGGEEFIIILEPIPEAMAAQTLERFRIAIEQFQFPAVGHITISVGYAKIGANDYPPTVLEQADQALYYAKEHGRNAVFGYQLLIDNNLLALPQQDEGSVDLFF